MSQLHEGEARAKVEHSKWWDDVAHKSKGVDGTWNGVETVKPADKFCIA